MITMLLGGLWHGGAWTFVIWGGLHGLALVVHRAWSHRRNVLPEAKEMEKHLPPKGPQSIGDWLVWFLTMYWVCVAWICFRAVDLEHAVPALRGFVLFQGGGIEQLGTRMLWVVAALGFVHWLNSRGVFSNWWRRLPGPVFAAGYGCAFAVVLLFIPPHYAPFIYFQF
jgi:alginate O-acetyltransferase complex protein AlgI